jgi:hypothetical protein
MSLGPDMQTVPLISYQEFITILLTALAVMLTILGLGLAALAFLGYTGLKEFVTGLAAKHVAAAIAKYPDAAKVEEMYQRMKASTEFLETKALMVAKPADEPTAPISASYPGEEPLDVDNKPL